MVVRFNSEQIAHAFKTLQGIPGGIEMAAVPALNRANAAARAEGIRQASKTYTARQEAMRKTVRMYAATRTSLVAGFSSKSNKLPLMQFNLRPKKVMTNGRSTLKAAVRRGGFKVVKKGFIQNGPRGMKAFRRIGKERYPLRELFGPSVPQMLNETGVMESIEARAFEVLSKRFDHEIGRVLARSMK
jgi:hypothetical protein